MTFSQQILFSLTCLTTLSFWFFPLTVSGGGFVLIAGLALYLGSLKFAGACVLFGAALLCKFYDDQSGWFKVSIGVILSGVAIAIYLHFVPGFENFLIAENLQVSPTSVPYTIYVNMDKILMGLILLFYYKSSACSLTEWKRILRLIPIPLVVVCLLLIGSAYAIGYIEFDPKLPDVLIWWIPLNLLGICVMEEVLYRGFIQKELMALFPNTQIGKWGLL